MARPAADTHSNSADFPVRAAETPASGSVVLASREQMLAKLAEGARWDIAIVGGGATGLGVALDAAVRGHRVALIEAEDFAKGTSSRATKLVHGGVRYLAQGDLALVREALAERRTLLANAPHLARPLQFVMPVYGARGRCFDKWFYGAGLVLYDMLAGRAGLGPTRFLNRAQTIEEVPGVRTEKLAGAVEYWDGQFDDARLALALARTAIAQGACVLNHCRASALLRENGKVAGVVATDTETDRHYEIRANCVINATGVWVDAVRRLDDPDEAPMVAPSQGVHLVVDRSFQPTDRAILVPGTTDGRVLFVVPWMGSTILGTTDTAREDLAIEPRPLAGEVEFILRESARYLQRAPKLADVRSIWVGLRPLVKPTRSGNVDTKRVSREHTVLVADSGLVTVTGGKWTTYRAMAEDVLDECAHAGLLDRRARGVTETLPLIGAPGREQYATPVSAMPGLHLYGTEAAAVSALPGADLELAPGLSEAMVRFAVRAEYARSVEDVLARRSRLLFLDARAALALARPVARILREELGAGFDADGSAAAFEQLAASYLPDIAPAR